MEELEVIEKWFYWDIQVSKYACSRRELNVSFWVISWHSMSDVGARNVMQTQVSP